MFKRCTALIAAVIMIICIMPAVYAADSSGKCGDSLTWSVDSEGILTISGSGAMWDFKHNSPWCYNSKITKAVIPEGVTRIGSYAFEYCSAMEYAELPESVKNIGEGAFYGCGKLKSINLPEGLASVGDYAFMGCVWLTGVSVPRSVTQLGELSLPKNTDFIVFGYKNTAAEEYAAKYKINFTQLFCEHKDENSDLICDICGETVISDEKVSGVKSSSVTENSMVLSWTAVGGASGYRIEKYDGAKKEYTLYANCVSNYIKIMGLAANSNVYFKLTPYIVRGEDTYFGTANDVVMRTLPTRVTGLKAAGCTANTFKLTWTKIPGVTGYRIYKYDASKKLWVSCGITDSKTNVYTVKNLPAGASYYFSVRAYRAFGAVNYYGAYSASLAGYTRTAAPTLTSLTSVAKGAIKPTWKKVSGATGYEIQYSVRNNFSVCATKYAKNTVSTAAYTGLLSARTYYVRVRAYRTVSGVKLYSSFSNVRQIKVK